MKKTKNDNLNENTKETSKDVIDETCRESIAMDEKEKLNEEKQENFEKGDSDGSSLDSDQKSAAFIFSNCSVFSRSLLPCSAKVPSTAFISSFN